jgi:hypothetical protein
MKILLMGMARHGKDSACLHLEKHFGLKWAASSMFACQTFLFEQMKDKYGYASVQECYDDRVNHRQFWYEAIRDYNAEDRTRLGRGIFAHHSIYCGIRDREEFEALKAIKAFDLAIWVDASDRLPPEDVSSMNLNKADADIIISNNNTEEAFYKRLDALFKHLPIIC